MAKSINLWAVVRDGDLHFVADEALQLWKDADTASGAAQIESVKHSGKSEWGICEVAVLPIRQH